MQVRRRRHNLAGMGSRAARSLAPRSCVKEILTHTHTLTMFVLENVTDPQTPTEYSDVPMDGGVAETLGATLPQASSPPAEGAAGAALRLDDVAAA